jgi:hypothetical protein
VHRQDILHHPKCFAKGLIRGAVNIVPKSQPNILMLDIETSPISVLCWGLWEQNINIGAIIQDWHILSWSAKWLFSDIIVSDVLTPEEAGSHNDERVCASIWNLLDQADVVVTHNGNSFDLKRLQTRFLLHHMIPPRPYQSVDTLKIAKEQFNFSSNKLDYINEYLGLPKKESTNFELWRKCFEGDPESLQRLQVYNRNDTSILEDLYLRFLPFVKGHPNRNLWSADNVSICPNCGSERLDWGGYYYTYTGRYKSFRCLGCGATGRSRSLDPEFTKEKRATIVR